MDVFAQDSLAGGIWRASEGERIPNNSMYDCVNGLLDEEGAAYRRGGSTYMADAYPAVVYGIADVNLPAGRRTLAWSNVDPNNPTLGVLAANDTTWVTFATGLSTLVRAHGAGSYVAIPRLASEGGALLYAGSRKTATYGTGTISTTLGSRAVTGSGTAWVANVDAGMILQATNLDAATVATVDSDTQLTLRDPASQTNAGIAYSLAPTATISATTLGVPTATFQRFSVGSVGSPPRLILTFDNRAYFSEPGLPFDIATSTFHELPATALITATTSFRDNLVLFTTEGVWTVGNMNLDALDADGNVQHTVSQVNKEISLWGDGGLAAWSGALLVPALDDIYLMPLQDSPVLAPDPISKPIRPLYREYVNAGYTPGLATVFRGHYFLPIVDDATVVDVLVCNLNMVNSRGGRAPAWTRWADHAACIGYATRYGAGSPRLFGINGTRLLDLTGTFAPTGANINDATGTAHTFTIVTRAFSAHRAHDIQWKKLRARFTATAATPVTAEQTSDYAAYATLGTKTIDPTGAGTTTWPVNKRRRTIAFRVTAPTPTGGKIALRGLEVFYRQVGSQ